MKKLIGYVGNAHLGKMAAGDIKALDGINIAFGQVKDHRVDWDAQKYVDDIRQIRAIHPDLKILLSVGGWGAGGFSIAASTEENRNVFAESAQEIVEVAALDGIDLDWEYPGIDAAGIDASPDDQVNFTLLLAALRKRLGDDAMLTIAAGASEDYVQNTEMDKVAPLLDYVQVMTYDLANAYVQKTGHHTNLHNYEAAAYVSSVRQAVEMFIQAGVPAEKIVIGAAFYSRRWRNVKNENRGYNQPAETIGDFGPDYGDLMENYMNQNGFVRYWDDEAKAPYLFDGQDYITYDDEASIGCKIDYLKEKGLLGIMYWEYRCDSTQTLTQMMAKRLNDRRCH